MANFFSQAKRYLLTRAIIVVILVIIAGLLLRRCDQKKIKEITSEELKAGEQTAIIIGSGSRAAVEVVRRATSGTALRSALLRGRITKPEDGAGTVIDRIDGARDVRISITPSGTVSVTARTRGFCFDPGFGAYTTNSDRRVLIDAQLLFSRRHGVNAGIGMGLRGRLNGAAFLAYSYNFWSNSSILVGFDTTHRALVGLRVKF